ncbi:hypothetical protein [Streptomyces antibioticus]|nr:hypothetical protein [Streptomyces antibioticus]
MAKECVFCGEKAGSREHVLPAWMAREAPKAFTESNGTRNVYKDGRMIVVPDKFATATVKCVCGTCNNGWMSNLEASAKPFLMQLTRGDQIALGPTEQTALATWSLKTAMMMLRASYRCEPHPIPKSDYKHLYEHKKLSMRRMRANAFLVEPPGDDESHIWGDLVSAASSPATAATMSSCASAVSLSRSSRSRCRPPTRSAGSAARCARSHYGRCIPASSPGRRPNPCRTRPG